MGRNSSNYCDRTKPSPPRPSHTSTTTATTERRYSWIDENENVASRRLTPYECKLEDEVQNLQDALFTLSSHYAKIQFRLRQICNASGTERDCLMRELDRIISQDIDANRDNDEIPSLLEDMKSFGNVRTRQDKIVAQIRSRLRNLADFTNVCYCAEPEVSYNYRKYEKKRDSTETETIGEHDSNCCCIVCKQTKRPHSDRGYISEIWPNGKEAEEEGENENDRSYTKKKSISKKNNKKRQGRSQSKRKDSKSKHKYSTDRYLNRISLNTSSPRNLWTYSQCISNINPLSYLKTYENRCSSLYSTSKRNCKRSSDISSLITQESSLRNLNSNHSRSSFQRYRKSRDMNTKQRNFEKTSIQYQNIQTPIGVERKSKHKARGSASTLPIEGTNVKERRSSKIDPEQQDDASTSNLPTSRSRLSSFLWWDTKKNNMCDERGCKGASKISSNYVDPRNVEESKKRKTKTDEKTNCNDSNRPRLKTEIATKNRSGSRHASWASQSNLETKYIGKSQDKRTSYERQLYQGLCSKVRKIMDDQKLNHNEEYNDEKRKRKQEKTL